MRYGTPGTTNDQQTLDVLNEINLRRKRIWSYWNWAWALEALSIPIVANTTVYLVSSKSGNLVDRITDLIPQDSTTTPVTWAPPLTELERQDFYAWFAAQPTASKDLPSKYVNLGLDPAGSGKWQIEIAPSPSAAFTMKGYAKKLLTTYVLADYIANVAMTYFPDGIIEDVLLTGVNAGISRIQGYPDAGALDQAFEAKLKMMKTEQSNVGRDDSGIKTPPPPSIRTKYRSRSKQGTGVW